VRIAWDRLQGLATRLGDTARCAWEDVATMSSCLVLEAVDHLPAAQERTRMQRLMVREAFAAGREYERLRLGLQRDVAVPPTDAGHPAGRAGSARRERHLHLV
jgi:hypothetical protein